MKTMIVYILECADGSYYTGVTNDLDRRLIEHASGYDPSCYTFTRRPIKLVYYNICFSPKEAILLEKRNKNWSKAKKEAFIKGDWKKMHELAVCRNKSNSENYKND